MVVMERMYVILFSNPQIIIIGNVFLFWFMQACKPVKKKKKSVHIEKLRVH